MAISLRRLQRSLRGGGSKPIDTTPRAPTNVNLPTISDTSPAVGQTLSAGNGYWDAFPFPTYTYQWQADTAGNGTFANIVGATSGTYVVTSDELGDDIRVVVTATNSEGNASANSAATDAVAAADTTPAAFSFTDVTDATRSTVYTSNTITVSGINLPASISITGGEYQVNGGSWTSAGGSVENGDTVAVRGTSSGSYETAVNVVLTIGGVSDTYTITTEANPDRLPINSVIIFDGDSNSAPAYEARTWSRLVLVKTNGRYYLPPDGNMAVSGQNSDDGAKRVAAGLAQNPKAVCLVFDSNQNPGGSSGSIADWDTMIDAYVGAGARVVGTCLPRVDGSTDTYINTILADLDARGDITVIDPFEVLTDITEGGDYVDNAHLSETGRDKLATAFAAVLNGWITTDDVYTNDVTSLIDGDFAGTGGTAGTGASGSIATGWTLTRTNGAGTATASKTTQNGATAQQLVLTGGAAGSRYTFYTSTDYGSSSVAGEVYEGWVEVSLSGNDGSLTGIGVSAGNNVMFDDTQTNAGIDPDRLSGVFVWRVPPEPITANGTTWKSGITIGVAASETVTVILSRFRTVLRHAATDLVPASFTFTDETGVSLNSTRTSNVVQITGLDKVGIVSVSGGTWRKNYGPSYTSGSGYVVNGALVDVRHTSSGTAGTTTTTTLTIGGVSETFTSVTIADTTPDAFTFTDVTDATISTLYTSNTITVAGIDAAASISITGGEYQIDSGSWTSSSGTVTNGQTVKVRVTSSGSNSTTVSATLTIGGVSDTYSVTTEAAGGTITISITDGTGYAGSEYTTDTTGGQWYANEDAISGETGATYIMDIENEGKSITYRIGGDTSNAIEMWTPVTDLGSVVAVMDIRQGLTLTGSAVDQWDSQVGGVSASQATNKPTYSATQLDGTTPGIDFDGTNDTLDGLAIGIAPSARSMIFVASYDNAAANYSFIGPSANGGVAIRRTTSSTIAFVSANTGVRGTTSGTIASTTTSIVSVRFTASGSYSVRSNAVSVGTGTLTGGFSGTGTVRLGVSVATADIANGKLSSVVIADANISDADNEKVEGWIAHTLNRLDLLASGHPYKTAAPTV